MAEEMIEAIERYGLSKRNRKRTLFSRIGVVGCGKEGSVIATRAALKGIEVVFLEPNQERIDNAYKLIEDQLNKKIQNWGLTENEKKAIIGRIQGSSNYEDFSGCDFVIEAIRYDDQTGERQVTQRKEVFRKLEEVLSQRAIIASNVSTVVVTELAAEMEHQDRCIGLHFLFEYSRFTYYRNCTRTEYVGRHLQQSMSVCPYDQPRICTGYRIVGPCKPASFPYSAQRSLLHAYGRCGHS